jgi:hypothetical protein
VNTYVCLMERVCGGERFGAFRCQGDKGIDYLIARMPQSCEGAWNSWPSDLRVPPNSALKRFSTEEEAVSTLIKWMRP